MQTVLVIVGALLSPLLGLALLLWLSHLEETLPHDVARAVRRPAPAPILAVPVRTPTAAPVSLPAQRTAPELESSPELAPVVP